MDVDLAPLFKLARAERLQLVEDLWDSIAAEDCSTPIAQWKANELRARKERLERNPTLARNWDQVKARARSRNE